MGLGKENRKEEGKKQNADPNGRTYLKIKATFKCSKAECGKTWTSVHAWERDEELFCESCEGKAEVKKFLDEMCDLGNYNCNCGARWQSVYSGQKEECWECGASVSPDGKQQRVVPKPFWKIKNGEGGANPAAAGRVDVGGKHNWEYCDMCQDLKGQGKAQVCLKFRKVRCQMKELSDGMYVEKIVEVTE